MTAHHRQRIGSIAIVGGGLAGLSCAFDLCEAGYGVTIYEHRSIVGGRTSSWIDNGMAVESGLHKFLGIYRALPELLKRANIDLSNTVSWVDDLEIHHPNSPHGRFIAAPYARPIGTLASALGNNRLIPPVDKLRMAVMGGAGLACTATSPHGLDNCSIAEFCRRYGISNETIQRVVSTSTQAILFLPADRFSAYAAFAPVLEGVKHGLTMRIGAFKGGMSQVMIDPLVKALADHGVEIRCNSSVVGLLVDDQAVRGLRLTGEIVPADIVVLATPLQVTQKVISDAFPQHPWFGGMLGLTSLSAATIQFELDRPLLSNDRTNFSSTSLCCFAEQSRTTFRGTAGRLSAILYPPDKFIGLPASDLVECVYAEAEKLSLPLRRFDTRYRVVNHVHDFYRMEPGSERLRPTQETPVNGLLLAGDYTQQPFSASMEGAVVSGRLAAAAIIAKQN
jgi:15-cis-phytoene desaturase